MTNRFGAKPSRLLYYISILVVLLAINGLSKIPTLAAGQDETGNKSALAVPPDAAELFDTLDDISHLNILIPLKLNSDQLDLLITAISSSENTFLRKYSMISVAEVRRLADLIHATKRKVLSGERISDDFDTQMSAMLQKRVNDRTQLNNDTLRSLSTTIRRILNEDQISIAVKQERGVQEKLGKHGTDAQMFNAFVQEVIIGYPRTVTLLKELRQISGEPKAQ